MRTEKKAAEKAATAEKTDWTNTFARVDPPTAFQFKTLSGVLAYIAKLAWPYKHKRDPLTARRLAGETGMSRRSADRGMAEAARVMRDHPRVIGDHPPGAGVGHRRPSEAAQTVEQKVVPAPVEVSSAPAVPEEEREKRGAVARYFTPKRVGMVRENSEHFTKWERENVASLAAAASRATPNQLAALSGIAAKLRATEAEIEYYTETPAERQALI